jgi:hypothetical protein
VTYEAFLTRVIDDGIEAARRDYADKPEKLRGAVAGFEACRGKSPVELKVLLDRTHMASHDLSAQAFALGPGRGEALKEFWETRCYEAEVEWVCNCVSAMLMNEGLPVIVQPTARGVLRADEVLRQSSALVH